jgi:hypothetical protein
VYKNCAMINVLIIWLSQLVLNFSFSNCWVHFYIFLIGHQIYVFGIADHRMIWILQETWVVDLVKQFLKVCLFYLSENLTMLLLFLFYLTLDLRIHQIAQLCLRTWCLCFLDLDLLGRSRSATLAIYVYWAAELI